METYETSIDCSDGLQLCASLYRPSSLKAAVLIGPATGIRKRFYNSFATFLAENGYGVLTFENRGIGPQHRARLNEVDASLVSWGRLDLTAAMKSLIEAFPETSYHLVGHSAGGQLVGLMDNAEELSSMFNFASSSGSLHNMSYPFRFQAWFFLNLFIPLSNALFKRANCQWVGMGEPLPRLVASQWSAWCNGRGYVENEFGKSILEHKYDSLCFPSMWLHANDDGIANSVNVQDMARVYTGMNPKIVSLEPSDYSLESIGHMKFFSKKCRQLWGLAIDWLDEQSQLSAD